MRIMALGTIALADDTVAAARILRQYVFVAAEAQIGGFGGQQVFMGRRMRVVAGGTFAGFGQRMHRATFDGLAKRFVAFQANLAFGAGLEFERVGRVCPGGRNLKTEHANREDKRVSEYGPCYYHGFSTM